MANLQLRNTEQTLRCKGLTFVVNVLCKCRDLIANIGMKGNRLRSFSTFINSLHLVVGEPIKIHGLADVSYFNKIL